MSETDRKPSRSKLHREAENGNSHEFIQAADAAPIQSDVSDEQPSIVELETPPAGSAAALSVELEAAENRALRAYADLDNYKKRFDRELARQRDLERERFLNVVLSIADNMRRALKVQDADSSPYRDGLLSVMRQIDNTLRDFGVEMIVAEKGQTMDPNVHEAITTLTIPGAEHESIVEIVEPGYRMGDRILRPAKVVVAKTEDE